MDPTTVDPDIAVAIPAMVAIIPRPTGMRRIIVNFDDWFRGRDADKYLGHCDRGDQAKTQEQGKGCLLHGRVLLQGFGALGSPCKFELLRKSTLHGVVIACLFAARILSLVPPVIFPAMC